MGGTSKKQQCCYAFESVVKSLRVDAKMRRFDYWAKILCKIIKVQFRYCSVCGFDFSKEDAWEGKMTGPVPSDIKPGELADFKKILRREG